MSDIVDRLLRWGYSADPSTANDLMGEAAAEIAHLRAEKASDWGAACESARAASAEIARLRLTDDERKAISRIYDLLSERSRELQAARRIEESTPYVQLAKTLQTMWERLK